MNGGILALLAGSVLLKLGLSGILPAAAMGLSALAITGGAISLLATLQDRRDDQ